MSLAQADFLFVTMMVRQRSSIDLQPGKEYLVESRLSPIARSMGEPDVSSLIARLRRGDPRLGEEVVDALTTNETSWFRDTNPFEAFTTYLLPQVTKGKSAGTLTIWSAACSSGQEAYSLAMLLLDWMPANPGWTPRLIGSDISARMVERAKAGRYSQLEVNRGLRTHYLVRHFTQDGRDWVLREQVRRLARFQQGNLALPLTGVPLCDIVFLRNVLIYFDLATKRTVLKHVRTAMRPGGFLVLGGAESALQLDSAFSRVDVGKSVIFRVAGGDV